ncbi:6-phosphofructokinase, alpha subunit [Tulasnella sp. UAMH 9824]|nr:6-phosphofructokinase, alpha subunit [Tulasnella sp. UAMH 9824]
MTKLTTKKMKIAVLTSGGDSAGMNAAVRAVVKMGILRGCETWIVREGYEGLVKGNTEAPETQDYSTTQGNPINLPESLKDDTLVRNLRFGDGPLLRDGEGDTSDASHSLKGRYIIRVGWDDVRGWMGEGGTFIGTARSTTFRTAEGRLAAARNLIKEGIDALVVCGGDGSLTGADKFRSEWPDHVKTLRANGDIGDEEVEKYGHLKIVGLVGSIDNDMALTDMTIGAPTALHRICEAIDNINTTAASHSRAFVVEVMGRHCGWLALVAGISSGADFIFIPERPPSSDSWEEEMCATVKAHRNVGKRKTIVIVAEGAHDKNLNAIRADDVKKVLAEQLGLDTRVTTLGHVQRGGRPCAWDRILPTLQGVEAVEVLLTATPDTPSYVIGISENKVTRVPLMEAVLKTQEAAKAISEKNFEKAMSLRDSEFGESLEAFTAISTLDKRLAEEKHRLRIAIMHVGAAAGGMNAATRTAIRFCHLRGHTPLSIHNGFKGLLNDHITNPTWLGVDNWMTRGGSELGTNRVLPSIDMGAVAAKFQTHSFDALLIIGGFEAFSALMELEEARASYPALRIPMVHLPATISNNVPLTDYSLGSDTSLNALVDACDAIKQSASASRNRVFVVETQGGKCGYIAALGALATGAVLVYTPEVGISLDTLRNDVKFVKERYGLDVRGKSEGRLVLRNEKASDIYTTEIITRILKEEGGSLFDSRSASLGHTLQGGIPSPMDRARAVRLSMKCMAFLEEQSVRIKGLKDKSRKALKPSAAVITIQGSQIILAPVSDVEDAADMKNRRGIDPWWAGLKDLAETLGGKTDLMEYVDSI